MSGAPPKSRGAQPRKEPARLWRNDDAACRGRPLALFYPEGGKDRTSEALRICAGCPVSASCLEAAMAEEKGGGQRYGVRGGRLPKQRKRLQSERTAAEKAAVLNAAAETEAAA